MRYVLLLALLAAAARAEEDAELRFLRAWYAIGDPAKRTAAEETFRLLAEAESTPADVKAQCLLGLAECARLRGDEPEARRILERLLRAHAGSEAAARARCMLGAGGYVDRIVVVPQGRYLDLDDGSLSALRRPVPGREAEMDFGGLLVDATPEPGFALLAGGASNETWQRVRTSEGRSSWVQVLDRRRDAVVRVVTRLSGMGDVLPAPRGPFCLGVAKGVEIRFAPSRAFARYRIERAAAGQEPVEIGVVQSPPFLDAKAEEGVRYLYRITGEDAEGARGLPATIEGTRASLGVVTGVAEMNRSEAKSFDFLLGRTVEDGDVTMTSAFGNWDGGSFADAFGREIRTLAPGQEEPRTAWDAESAGTEQIPDGSFFLVPLRGGGVARCRLEMAPERGRVGGVEALLHYEACGDSAVLPQPARLSAKRDEKGATIAVDVEEPYRVEKVEVTDVLSGRTLAPLPVTNGVAKDADAAEGQIREYRAVAVDAHGRKAAAAVARLALLPKGPHPGEFQFHYQQGFSIETGRIVRADEADVFFRTCAGGISSITLAAPRGIVNLDRIFPKDLESGRAEAIYDLVVSADPEIALAEEAQGDSRTPPTDVFVLRTRHGGWAKLVITNRGREGGWTNYLATVKYVFNAEEPVFSDLGGDEVGGVRFHGLQVLRDRADILGRWQQGWHEMAKDPARRKALEDEPREEGEMPDADVTQEVLWSRLRHGSQEKATFSFAYGVRDDPERRTRNDWCLQYGNGGDVFDVRLATDDRSTITDLGAAGWAGLARRKAIAERAAERAPVRFGHVYLVRTRDADNDFLTLLRVTALRPGDRVAFEWVRQRGGHIACSPGLRLDRATEEAIDALLTALPARPEARWTELERTKVTHMKLQEPEVAIGVADAGAEWFLEDLALVTGVRIVLMVKPQARISIFEAGVTPARILDLISEQTGLAWRIEDDGSVSVGGE